MRCGIPAYGFLRLQCKSCKDEKIVAFSCKKRGFCPSCCAKRMAEASTHLVENVLPYVPYRQFVITFPFPMRFWLQTNKKLYAQIHKLVIREINRYYIEKSKSLGIKDPKPGSISFTQRAGSALNLNIHAHILFADGVYSRVKEKPLFRKLEPITDDEVAILLEKISQKVMRYLRKIGYLDENGEIVENPMADDLWGDSDSLTQATARSIQGRIAFGANAGKYVTQIGSGFGYGEEIPLAKGSRCFSINGFSLHANTGIKTQQRDRLDKLIQYVARGPLSNERLEITDDNKVKLRLKTSYSDGTTHLLFTFGEFIEKLVALVPPPKSHLVRWGGCFAPNSPFRQEITLRPQKKKGFQFDDSEPDAKPRNYSWSKMLAKVFKIDVTECEKCGGEMTKIGSILDRPSIERYLRHVNIDSDPPLRAPPRLVQECLNFDQSSPDQKEEAIIYLD